MNEIYLCASDVIQGMKKDRRDFAIILFCHELSTIKDWNGGSIIDIDDAVKSAELRFKKLPITLLEKYTENNGVVNTSHSMSKTVSIGSGLIQCLQACALEKAEASEEIEDEFSIEDITALSLGLCAESCREYCENLEMMLTGVWNSILNEGTRKFEDILQTATQQFIQSFDQSRSRQIFGALTKRNLQ